MVYYEKKKMEPTHRTGFLGLFGPREKSIDFYRREKEVKERALVTERKSVTFSVSQKGAAIIIFSTRAAANSASQVLIDIISLLDLTIIIIIIMKMMIISNEPLLFTTR